MQKDKLYSEMTEYEINQDIALLNDKAKKASQLGMVNEYAVLERKIALAKCYLLNPDDFLPGEIYEINGDPGAYFKVDYVNGVFAWGYRLDGNKQEEALPISLLKNLSRNQ